MAHEVATHLCCVVDGGSWGGRNAGPNDLKRAKKLWLELIEEHAEEIQGGKRFRLEDPALRPEMFPMMTFYRKDGTEWPER